MVRLYTIHQIVEPFSDPAYAGALVYRVDLCPVFLELIDLDYVAINSDWMLMT